MIDRGVVSTTISFSDLPQIANVTGTFIFPLFSERGRVNIVSVDKKLVTKLLFFNYTHYLSCSVFAKCRTLHVIEAWSNVLDISFCKEYRRVLFQYVIRLDDLDSYHLSDYVSPFS